MASGMVGESKMNKERSDKSILKSEFSFLSEKCILCISKEINCLLVLFLKHHVRLYFKQPSHCL